MKLTRYATWAFAFLITTSSAFGEEQGITFVGSLSDRNAIAHETRKRTYRVYLPKAADDSPLPAVFLLHGHGGNSDQLLGLKGRRAPYRLWLSIADQHGLILIVPDGLVGPDGKTGWNDARNLSTNTDANDVGFLLRLIELVSESRAIDRSRVYASGMSNGGHMVLRLAAEAPAVFSAVAAVAAANPVPRFPERPDRSVSVMLINGTKDRILPYDGGKMPRGRGSVQSTADSIKYWVGLNACNDTPISTEYPDRSKVDGCTASSVTYRNDTTNTEVVLVKIDGGGHAEPSVKQPYSRLLLRIVGRQNRDMEMAEVVWDFFRDKSVAENAKRSD